MEYRVAEMALPFGFAAQASLAGGLLGKTGTAEIDDVADALGLTRTQLAETVGLGAATLTKADRRASAKARGRITELVEILDRIAGWAGGTAQALVWYRSQPIPALDGRTAEALVKTGQAAAVRDYLDHLALGGYA